MSKGYKRLIVPVISLVILIACVSCAVISKVNENAKTAPITSKWTFDHATNKGENVPRHMFDRDEDLPHFSSDGETFTFNIVPGSVYTGTITQNDNGSYTLINNGNEDKPIIAEITGNALTIIINDDTNVVFVVI
jgi:hypothetical protein